MASSEPTPRKRLAGVRGLERLRFRYAQKRDLRSIWCLLITKGQLSGLLSGNWNIRVGISVKTGTVEV